MTSYIDADALIEKLSTFNDRVHGDTHFICGIESAKEIIQNEPTVDAVPVKRGEWRFVHCATGLRCQCSECLHWVDAGTDKNYCPNCGARMDMKGTEG